MSAPRLSAGGVIAGKYTVRSMLGNGGAVITYHCQNQQGQDVAVKLYAPAVASHTTVMKSLEQAYAATNALPPSSAAPIIDAGYDQPTLAPFSVTELIRLPSLAAQQRRLPPEEVVELLKGLARSLDLAHVRNVVHGAIKPTNVFAGPSSNPVIVTDFASNLPKAAVPTQEGFVLSAPWIAPEQAQSGSVGPAADVFSVGLLVFFALTGRTYWRSCQGPNFDLNGWQQELASPRTPASARAAELGVPLSPTLDMVIWKALSQEPGDRFKSIGEFQNVLEDSLRQQVGSAATMALPMVGDAPSPLPAGMKNPEGPRPAAGAPAHPQGATVALTADQLMPPNQGAAFDAQQAAYAQQQMAMSGQQQAYAMSGQNPQLMMSGQNPMMMSGQNPQMGYGQAAGQMGNGQMGYGQAPMPSPSQAGMYAYSQGRDQGYPPPPMQPAKQGGSKIVPIIIGFTAVALLGVVGTLVFLKLKNEQGADGTPVTAPSATQTETATPDPPPTSPPTATQVETAPQPSASTSAAPEMDVKITCKPSCDEIKVDGKAIDLKKPLKLTVGSHEVEVTKAGYVGQTEKLEVKSGSSPVVKTFALQQEKGRRPPADGEAAEHRRRRHQATTMQKGRAHQEVLTSGRIPVRVWFLLGLIGCGDGAEVAPSSSAIVSVELPPASASVTAASATLPVKPPPPPRPALPEPDLYPSKLDDQREAMFRRMKVMLGIGDTELDAVKAIFAKSPVLGQGNPEITEYAMTRAECAKIRVEANVVDEDDPICGAPFMVPLWDPKAGETKADAKVCIDRYEFPNIPCEYPVTWVQGVEAAKLCKAIGKRICDTHEWEGGCAGALHAPDVEYKFGKPRKEMKFRHNEGREIVWAYGAEKDHTKCGTASHKNKTCKESGWKKCGSNSYPAGSFPACKSSFGVYDQHGNVAEHMNMPLNPKELASAGGAGETEMKGSWFIFQKFEAHDDDCRWRAPDWHAAKLMSPDSHLNYHLGFRCCKDVGAAAPADDPKK